ncbi:MAG: CoA pyrophosphatase [Acidobacteria bacterium]|nr:CoA pyrophosphatase [Acidobacteriota bacterium]
MRSFATALRTRLASTLPGLEAQLTMAPQPRPGWDPPAVPPGLRLAAGLLLVYPHAGVWQVPLTLRASALRHHTGQVSLPGGRVDAGESFEQAALREAFEEIGLAPGAVEILGRLSPLHIPVSNHLLHPVVGIATERPMFVIAEAEVERLIEVPLSHLRAPEAVRWEQRMRERGPSELMDVPYFDVEGARVWGATAMVLAEFLAVLDAADAVVSR